MIRLLRNQSPPFEFFLACPAPSPLILLSNGGFPSAVLGSA